MNETTLERAIPSSISESPSPSAVERVLSRFGEQGVKFGELWFTELTGRPWRIDIGAHQVHARAFAEGVTLDGPSTGRPWKGLFTATPDPASCFLDPVARVPTLAMFCDVRDADTGEAPLDPRLALKRALAYMRSSGVADTMTVGAEGEFFLLDNGAPVAEEVLWDFVRELAVALGRAGIPVDGFRYGPNPGQGRVQMRADDPVRTSDQVQLYKNIVRTLARREGRAASFLPCPLPGEAAASLPLHQALFRDGKNVFHDESGWALTSSICRYYAGGLLAHAPALLAFCAPTKNSYRWLSTPQAPTVLALSRTNPAAVCRVPARSSSPASRRLKFRCADATGNPYLIFATTLMAGLDGVARRIEPPIDCNADPTGLPRRLDESLDALEDDNEFLRAGGVFDEELIGAWLKGRRTAARSINETAESEGLD